MSVELEARSLIGQQAGGFRGTSLALPLGFTLGTSAQARRTYYDGSVVPHLTLDRKARRDRTRTFTLSVLNRAELRFVRQFQPAGEWTCRSD